MNTPGNIPLTLLPLLFNPILDDVHCAVCVIEIRRDDFGTPTEFVGRVASQLLCELLSLKEGDILGKTLPESLSQTLALPALLHELTLSVTPQIHKEFLLGPGRICTLQAHLPCPELLIIAIRNTQPLQAMVSSQAEVILASLGEPCTIIDRNFSILYENETAKQLWGSNFGRNCYTIYHGRQSRCESCHAEEVFNDGEIHKNEKVARIDGSERHLEITSAPLKDDTGQVTAVVNITHDVTIRKMTEKGKEHLIRELQSSLTKTKRLNGLLPICSYCKKIKDKSGSWQQLESYLRSHAEVEFSHGICEECGEQHHPQVFPKKK
ncbi:PAS domain-containing protein [Thiovibrio frasassiensis]|uniref:PAS domain-containing protein n=1 Tax=Thiovibrio frasassiensis TaxID=2984131 RepID=A0A9X4MEA4_9BACT|nr:PAS domain-containing protein [Thiovibrio frasassiensis]MDG4474693.1 PAS domain-containing protein [Thiovibrio frasassiensis]